MRGFTLIELLATIVILVIILFIATYTIITLIDNSRKNSLELSTEFIVKAVELDIARRRSEGDLRKVEYIFENGIQTVSPIDVSILSISGKLPEKAKIIAYEDGRVEAKVSDGVYYVATNGNGSMKEAVTYVPEKHNPIIEGTNSWIFEVAIATNGFNFRFFAMNPNLNINWGDNTQTNSVNSGATTISHVYQKGVYNVTLTGTTSHISFCSLTNALSFSCNGSAMSVSDILTPVPLSMGLTSANSMLAETRMTSISSLNFFDEASANITDMSWMFFRTRLEQSLDTWNTSNVTSMYGMFHDAFTFNGSIIEWDTSNVTNMGRMFTNAELFNQPIGTWNTSNVTNMSSMLSAAMDFNQPIGTWNTGKVTNMSLMFRQAYAFNQPIGTWNTSNLTNAVGMFTFTQNFNQPIGAWDTSKITSAAEMFRYASAFNQPIGTWNTSSMTNMSSMFMGSSVFNQNLSTWCVTNFPTQPSSFDSFASAWVLSRPIWGTCP